MLVFYTTCIDRNTSLLGVQLAPPRRLLVGVVGDLKKKYNKRNEYMRKELKNRYHSFIFTRLLLDRLTTLSRKYDIPFPKGAPSNRWFDGFLDLGVWVGGAGR